MEQLKIQKAEKELESKIDNLLNGILAFKTKKADTLFDKVKILNIIRMKFYENINQYQHESLLITTCKYLKKQYNVDIWKWHPNQTSMESEVDLMGYKNDKLVVCAEVTTSNSPNGKIDTIMRNTLDKLDKFKNDKYYVVMTDEMHNRAKSKINNRELNINILKL